MDYAESLKKVSLFADYPADALKLLSQLVEKQNLDAGSILFQKGDLGDSLYIIEKGEVTIYATNEAGEEITFAHLDEGDYFGEMSLIENKPRSASARALQDSEMLILKQQDFVEVLNANPSLALKLAQEFSSRLRTTSESVATGTFQALPITEALEEEQKVRVFISYSRRDKEFVRKLNQGLTQNGIDTWVDWENIPLGTDWWAEIVEAIQENDIFIFVVSPDSVESEVCGDEIRTAVENNKRLVPILHREEKDTLKKLAKELQKINFTFMRDTAEYEKMLPDFVTLLNTDLEYVKQHTHLQERAIDWLSRGKRASQELRKEDLEEAELWLMNAAGKEPKPTELQVEFIHASRNAASKRQRRTNIRLSIIAVVMAILAVVSGISFFRANESQKAESAARQVALTNEALARQAEGTAVAAKDDAEKQRATALAAEGIAVTEKVKADSARDAAVSAEEEAIRQRGIAEEQRQDAEAQRLASQASQDLARGNLLSRSLLLAISSLEKKPIFQGDLALRQGLDLLPALMSQMPPESVITQVAFSPNGRWLATGELDGLIQVWDVNNWEEAARLEGHGASILDMDFNPDGTQLVTASTDGTARLWDPVTGEQLMVFEHGGPVRAVKFSPLGNWVATASDDNFARVWNPRNGREVARVVHGGRVTDISFSPGGSWVASGSFDRFVNVWGPTTSEVFFKLPLPSEVTVVEFSPTEIWLATGTKDGTVIVWDPSSGNKLSQFAHEDEVTDITFSPDGRFLVTTSRDKTARIWETRSGQPIALLSHDRAVIAATYSQDGKWVATASEDDTARVWDAQTGEELARMEHKTRVNALAFTPNDQVLATAGQDEGVKVWSPQAVGHVLFKLQLDSDANVVDFSPDEQRIVTAGRDQIVRIWDISGEQSRVLVSFATDSEVLDADFSEDGQFIATGTADNFATIWNASTGTEIARFEHDGPVEDVDFSLDGAFLATGSADNTARLWEITTGLEFRRFETGGVVWEVDLNPDGSQIATASEDGFARVWNILSGQPVLSLEHTAPVFLVNFIQEKNWLITVARPNVVRVWDAQTGKPVERFFNDSSINAIEISADGSRLAISGEDNSVRVWDFESGFTSGREVARIEHEDLILDIAFGSSTSIDLLATASSDNRVLISLLLPQDLKNRACQRLTRNLTLEEWQQFFKTETYEITCPDLPPDPAAITDLKKQAGALGALGDFEQAVNLLEYIKEIDPSQQFDVTEELQGLIIDTLLDQGFENAQDGEFSEALGKYTQLKQDYSGILPENARYAKFLTVLCKSGGNAENAPDAISICDEAIELDPANGEIYDSRGYVRAWLGEYDGAVEDFQFAQAWKSADESADDATISNYVQERAQWIATLQSGANPFDE